MYDYTVIITSALYTKLPGHFTAEQRIEHTIETIKSVREKIPNCCIFLIDSSDKTLQQDQEKMNSIISLCDIYYDNSDDVDVKNLHSLHLQNKLPWQQIQNMMEAVTLISVFENMSKDMYLKSIVNNSKCVIKLSGRYTLTDRFDVNMLSIWTSYTFRTRYKAWIDSKLTNVDHYIPTRLWSFTPSLLDNVKQVYYNIVEYMNMMAENNQYVDLEHCMAMFVPKDLINEVSYIGVKGQVALNGTVVEE